MAGQEAEVVEAGKCLDTRLMAWIHLAWTPGRGTCRGVTPRVARRGSARYQSATVVSRSKSTGVYLSMRRSARARSVILG
ncbi:hypothetical protein BJF83_24355 [Nocardiopsis sp. CNR-923]|nr:hypothetical protein BJF83_24355 [Nocardiopsis sp. CNR-923]